MVLFSIGFLVALSGVLLSICYWTVRTGISPMPTTHKIKKALIKALPEHIEGTIVELGSGWGTLVFPIAKRYPACNVIGYELSPIPYAISQLRLLFSRYKNITFKRKDFFKDPLQDASVAICYLYPGAMQKLKEKFEKKGDADLLIVTHTFAIPGWTPEKVIRVDDLYKTQIYFYSAALLTRLSKEGTLGRSN